LRISNCKLLVRIAVCCLFLSAFIIPVSLAGTKVYFDKAGKMITKEQYLMSTDKMQAPLESDSNSSAPPPKKASPVAKAAAAETVALQTSQAEEDDDEDSGGYGNDLNFVSETILRVFERDTLTKPDAPVVPIYQYLTLDYGSSKPEGFSAHFQGWGRLDAADSEFFENQHTGACRWGLKTCRVAPVTPFMAEELPISWTVFTKSALHTSF